MAEKELLAYLVAHNLNVRCVMAEAVAQYSVNLERISFKGTVDALRQRPALPSPKRATGKCAACFWGMTCYLTSCAGAQAPTLVGSFAAGTAARPLPFSARMKCFIDTVSPARNSVRSNTVAARKGRSSAPRPVGTFEAP